MRKSPAAGWIVGIAMGIVLAVASAQERQAGPVVGFLMGDARGHQSEFIRGARSHGSAGTYGTRVLAPAGFRFALGEKNHFFEAQRDLAEQTTYQTLQQFNVMVLAAHWSPTGLTERVVANAHAAGRAVERYVREGGSIMILVYDDGYPNSLVIEYNNLLYKSFGLEILREAVWDAERQFAAPVFQGGAPEDFFHTENIQADHPVGKGVERLALARRFYGPGVFALRLSPEWEVIVRGEESARSHPASNFRDRYDVDYEVVGTYSSSPPIAAVREYGKGRIMVYSISPVHTYLNYGTPGWQMITEETGFAENDLPSHGNRFFLNGIRWLAETAKDVAGIGTFPFEDFVHEPVTFPAAVAWDDQPGIGFSPPFGEGVRGVVGARTALSNGSGTVKDYAEAAQAAGLSFIVFTEALEHLSQDGLAQLKDECRGVSTDTFYAVPGVEFADHLGNRWATWSDRISYPPETIKVGNRDNVSQWDGTQIHQLGHYLGQDERPPAALLTYSHLRQRGGHPHNMWWFFRVAPMVFDRDELVEDNREELFYALRDLKRVEPISYTRMTSPKDVPLAANTMVTVARDMERLRAWMNSVNSPMNMPAAVPYVSSRGGSVRLEQWASINNQMRYHHQKVQGVQRVRLRFQVSSENGIREVRVRDASLGVVRRFVGNGQKELAQEFEMVHDRDYYLVLEVEDEAGAFALSSAIYLWCYKASVFRCADNHNLLNGRGLVWHSCWDQMLTFAPGGGSLNNAWMGEAVAGYDSSAPWRQMSSFSLTHSLPGGLTVNTRERPGYPSVYTYGAMQRMVMDIPLPGRDPIVIEMDIGDLVERHGTDERPHPVYAGLPVKVAENELFHRVHRAYYFQNRTDMFIVWDHRRAAEGTAPCRGDVVWHEGEITFKEDAELAGAIPIPLAATRPIGGAAATHLLAVHPEGLTATPLTGGDYNKTLPLAPGGYITAVPNNLYAAFYAPSDSHIFYRITPNAQGEPSQLVIGMGEPGQKVSAGQTIRYRFAVVTTGEPGPLANLSEYVKQLNDMGESLGLDGRAGVNAQVKVGKTSDREMFFTIEAENHEVLLDFEPRQIVIALPFRIRGLRPNGAAAVWSSARPWFRFVGMHAADALFQEDIDHGGTIWAGNVFVCDHDAVAVTLVAAGRTEGRPPFVELHNPTDQPVTARVWSPENTPRFGGTSFTLLIPAGASVRHELPDAK